MLCGRGNETISEFFFRQPQNFRYFHYLNKNLSALTRRYIYFFGVFVYTLVVCVEYIYAGVFFLSLRLRSYFFFRYKSNPYLRRALRISPTLLYLYRILGRLATFRFAKILRRVRVLKIYRIRNTFNCIPSN